MSAAGDDRPIVVGGCYRSGTSLVRRLLDSHSRIHCGPEVKLFRDFYADYLGVEDPIAHLRFLKTAGSLLPEEDRLEILGAAFVEMHERAARQAGKPRWADKAPENVVFLEQWERLLGDDWVLLHVVRNPLDTLASIKEVGFPRSVPAHLEGRIYLYLRYAHAGLAFQDRNPDRYVRLVYDDLVGWPEATLGGAMAALGEEMELGQLSFNSEPHQTGLEDPRVSETDSIHGDGIGRWPETLTGAEAEQIVTATAETWSRLTGGAHSLPGVGEGTARARGEAGSREDRKPRPRVPAAPAAARGGQAPEPVRQDDLIVVVGRGRSGTRMLSQTLYASGVYMGQRLNYSGDKVPAKWMYEACRLLTRHVEWKGGLSWDFQQLQSRDVDVQFRAAVTKYLRDVLEATWVAHRGWKLPETILAYPWIARMFPDARYVYLVRDPRDCIMGKHVTDDLDRFGIPHPEPCDQLDVRISSWKYQYDIVKATPRPERFHMVRYEDLVLEQEAALGSLEEFLGLPLARVVVNASGVGRWKDDRDVLDRVEPLAEAMRECGYD